MHRSEPGQTAPAGIRIVLLGFTSLGVVARWVHHFLFCQHFSTKTPARYFITSVCPELSFVLPSHPSALGLFLAFHFGRFFRSWFLWFYFSPDCISGSRPSSLTLCSHGIHTVYQDDSAKSPARQRTRPARSGCHPRVPWASSRGLGRWA